MIRTTNGAAARLFRLPMLIAFVLSGLLLDAQGTAQPPSKQPLPPALSQKPIDIDDPSQDKDADLPPLRFIIRSAFSLTPGMVKAIQAKSGDQQASAAAKGAAGGESASAEVAWGEPLSRTLPFSAPLDVSLAGKNVLALVRIVPVELHAAMLDLILQGQVWVKMPDSSLSFKTMVQTLSVALGSRLYFYPLGVDAKTGAPIAVEIRVDRQSKP